MAIVNRRSVPLAVHVASASPAEVRLVDETIDARFIDIYPPRMIGDRAYDSDPLDAHLREEFGIELIAPHRTNRVRPATQDGRALRRYKRRWVVERFFAWIGRNRRLAKDFEATIDSARAFLYAASIMLLVRRIARAS